MFTIEGCSLIRGVHYERFHCTMFSVVVEKTVGEKMFKCKIVHVYIVFLSCIKL